MRLLVIPALLLLTVTLLGPRASAAPTLATLNVQVRDLPKGSSLIVGETLTAAQAAKADKQPVIAYKKLGILLVDERGFNVVTLKGRPFLFTEVILVSSAAAAKALYTIQLQRAIKMNPTAKSFSVGHLGDQRFNIHVTAPRVWRLQ